MVKQTAPKKPSQCRKSAALANARFLKSNRLCFALMLAIAVFTNVIELAPFFDWLAIVAMLMLFASCWWRLKQLNELEEQAHAAELDASFERGQKTDSSNL
tara:strand:- start:1312 stop:1614 length:303 start_codon:yes stop_codon:yes gene_type:complete